LVCGEERARETEGESPYDARVIANAEAVVKAASRERIFKQQPSETPFNAQVLSRTFIPMAAPPPEEPCHVGQRGTEDWLYLKPFHLFFVAKPLRDRRGSVTTRARQGL
jgi:hypothetical protein